MRVLAALASALALAAIVTAAGSGAACPPDQCGPTATSVAGGSLLAVGTGAGKAVVVYDLADGSSKLVLNDAALSADGRIAYSRESARLKTVDLRSGKTTGTSRIGIDWQLAGTSADGRRVVLIKRGASKTTFEIRGPGAATVTLPGKLEFDGLRGNKLFVIEVLKNGYQVRVADLATKQLAPDALKDADEPALIQGQAWQRIASPNGRYVFTLYLEGDGAVMIHQLDMLAGTAKCIDLAEHGDYTRAISYAMVLSRDGKRIYAANGLTGVVQTVDVASRRVVRTVDVPRAALPSGNAQPPYASAALARDGHTLAFTNDNLAWIFDVRAGKVTKRATLGGVGAVAWSPRGALWVADRNGTIRKLQP